MDLAEPAVIHVCPACSSARSIIRFTRLAELPGFVELSGLPIVPAELCPGFPPGCHISATTHA